jgi:hypothetical protein
LFLWGRGGGTSISANRAPAEVVLVAVGLDPFRNIINPNMFEKWFPAGRHHTLSMSQRQALHVVFINNLFTARIARNIYTVEPRCRAI